MARSPRSPDRPGADGLDCGRARWTAGHRSVPLPAPVTSVHRGGCAANGTGAEAGRGSARGECGRAATGPAVALSPGRTASGCERGGELSASCRAERHRANGGAAARCRRRRRPALHRAHRQRAPLATPPRHNHYLPGSKATGRRAWRSRRRAPASPPPTAPANESIASTVPAAGSAKAGASPVAIDRPSTVSPIPPSLADRRQRGRTLQGWRSHLDAANDWRLRPPDRRQRAASGSLLDCRRRRHRGDDLGWSLVEPAAVSGAGAAGFGRSPPAPMPPRVTTKRRPGVHDDGQREDVEVVAVQGSWFKVQGSGSTFQGSSVVFCVRWPDGSAASKR